MNDPFRTISDYEIFLHSLKERFPSIKHSTLTLVKRGVSLARVSGEVYFDHGFRLVVRERMLFHRLPVMIDEYGYEVWKGDEKLYWYDSQPHPKDPSLQNTYPHHKHIRPNIKSNRIPALDCSFTGPNLSVLIRESEDLLRDVEK